MEATNPTQGPQPIPSTTYGQEGGLDSKEWLIIWLILVTGITASIFLMALAPRWLVSAENYRCPTTEVYDIASAPQDASASCLNLTEDDGLDHETLDAARTTARASLGVFAGALLAGSAAAIGVIVSSHNARLARQTLNETLRTNELTLYRDQDQAARDRSRTDDERFAKATEQLGNPSAAVRLGGLHILYRLATQEQLDYSKSPNNANVASRYLSAFDVFCGYLRQPFHHPDNDWNGTAMDTTTTPPPRAWWPANQKERDERDAEREVRRTASLLMAGLLPSNTRSNTATYNNLSVNLNGAMLDGLDLTGKRLGHLRLMNAFISGDVIVGHNSVVDGEVLIGNGATITGNLEIQEGAHVSSNLWVGEGSQICGDLFLGYLAHLGGDLQIDERAVIDGRVTVGESASIEGDIYMGEGSRVAGDLYLDQGASCAGRIHFSQRAELGGNLILDENAHVQGGLLLEEGSRVKGGLRLLESAYIKSGVDLRDGAHIGGSVEFSVKARLIGSLTIGDAAFLGGDVVLNAGSRIEGSIALRRGAHIDGSLMIGVASYIQRGLRLGDLSWIMGSVIIQGLGSIKGEFIFGNKAHIDGKGPLAEFFGSPPVVLAANADMSDSWFTEKGVRIKRR